jgi:very-short-patch-repair endonuclease
LGRADPNDRHALTAIAIALGRNVVVRRSSAACVHGFSVLQLPTAVEARQRQDFHDADITEIRGVMVTAPSLTVVDAARTWGAEAGIVIADSAMRLGAVTGVELAEQAARFAGRPGCADATLVATEADPRSESPLETLSRFRFLRAGLTRPELQVIIGGYRTDFLWRAQRVIGESDGLTKYGASETEVRAKLRYERQRQRELEELGFIVVRWFWDEIWRTPWVVIERLQRAFALAATRFGLAS